MDKASSVTAAFSAGKLPSTQQLNAFIDWLNEVGITQVEPSSNTELSSRGRILAGAIRQTLDAYRTLVNQKNGDNIVQEALWHLTEGDITVTSEAKAETKEVKSDVDALRSSLRTLLSIVWDSVSSEGTSMINDLLSLVRLSVADAAEVVEGQAEAVKETLRKVEDEVQSGKRDALGRDKKRLEEEKDIKIAWEHGMDTVKDTGSKVIDVSRSISDTAEVQAEKTNSRLQEARERIARRASQDPQYKQALETFFNVLQKRLNATLDAAAAPDLTLSKFLADTTPEQHISKSAELFQSFLERIANTSLAPLLDQIRTATSMILRNPKLKSWFDSFLEYNKKLLADPDFSRSEESTRERKDLRVRWRTLTEEDEAWKSHVDKLKKEWRKIESGIDQDQAIVGVRNAHTNLVRDVEEGMKSAGQEAQSTLDSAMEQATWFWRDLFQVYLPKMLSKTRDIPIPRTEYKDKDMEFVLENLDISSFNFLPSHVYIRNITDMDITTSDSASGPSRTSIGTLTHIRVQALQLKLDDVSFWYRDKQASVMAPSEFTGLMAFKLPEKGVDLDLKIRLIPATVTGAGSRQALKHFNVIEKAEVTISEEVEVEVKQSNHSIVSTLFKPLLVSRLRDALSRTLSQQLRFAIDTIDGVAFDVSKRQQVFEDTGLGGGTSLLAALWSEIGRIRRESNVDQRSLGVHATGTGVIVEQNTVYTAEGDDKPTTHTSRFAMGAEPQILSGEKRGPLGTGSERLTDKFERIGKEMGVDADSLGDSMDVDAGKLRQAGRHGMQQASDATHGVINTAKQQIESFRTSVQRKTNLEQGRSGWQSAAFDV